LPGPSIHRYICSGSFGRFAPRFRAIRFEPRPLWHADLHATLLALLGLGHEELTYCYGGRDFPLTDVKGGVVEEILA
jgi:hypothetical protein